MHKLRVLKIEGCKLETFAPSALPGSVKHISLQQNNIASLDSIVFGQELPSGSSGEVRLLSLDLSCNKLTVFPFASLHLQKELKILDLSRNQISKLEEKHKIDGEGKLAASGPLSSGREMTFNVFKNLRLIDLSSNKLEEFPVCLRDCPKLRIIRLIRNNIRSIPDEYLQTDQVSSSLEELILNNNPLK